LSVLNYLRDRACITVTLDWDMKNSQTGETMGLIRATNTGRRPVFINVVSLGLPRGSRFTHLVMLDSIGGTKLGEGEQPMSVPVKYDGSLAEYSGIWRNMRACATDSTGKKHYSRFPAKGAPVPQWVVAD